ncbi:uncharacterized protein LACBIDRAFT_324672 [Laccaria bicolor S238N-H82]|uniref:Predicted protein n=1 Tax=Laccaria bicolor (strain S238N-H82 / ATCC MYA-4686) TaxID=486041 RepID=B0D2N8_LACBS|nr:uncharacterized protein LACBIDRAFT_324672 [Laccaria bicolor S238N-H82]EDR10783.1 predicted protein [Laccaria bicolor S238N-H82]|eukprot:XP_001878084.1 predicted protein [Laccaria bicolor S238N-H82]
MQGDLKTWWACLLVLLVCLPPDQLAAKAYKFTIDETGSSSLRCFNTITDTAAPLQPFTDVLDIALIIGSRSASLLDIAASVEKQIICITAPGYRSTGFAGIEGGNGGGQGQRGEGKFAAAGEGDG